MCGGRERNRHFLVDVAQSEIGQLPRRFHVDLCELAFDPQITEPFNPALDLGIGSAD